MQLTGPANRRQMSRKCQETRQPVHLRPRRRLASLAYSRKPATPPFSYPPGTSTIATLVALFCGVWWIVARENLNSFSGSHSKYKYRTDFLRIRFRNRLAMQIFMLNHT
jgi:hypothetical protein